jgi:hypothetical protein
MNLNLTKELREEIESVKMEERIREERELIEKLRLKMEIERVRQELHEQQIDESEREIVERISRILRGRALSKNSYIRIRHLLDKTNYDNYDDDIKFKYVYFTGQKWIESKKEFIEKDEMEI